MHTDLLCLVLRYFYQQFFYWFLLCFFPFVLQDHSTGTDTIVYVTNIMITSHEHHVVSNRRLLELLFNSFSGPTSKKHQSPHHWPFVRGIHRWPVNSPNKGPVTRKKLPFDDVTMNLTSTNLQQNATRREACACFLRCTTYIYKKSLCGPLLLTWFNFNPSMNK